MKLSDAYIDGRGEVPIQCAICGVDFKEDDEIDRFFSTHTILHTTCYKHVMGIFAEEDRIREERDRELYPE